MLQNDGVNGLFAELPTEVCHLIMAYMDKDSKDAFAKCSRHCYYVAFPARFGGVKLSEVEYRYPLRVFTDGWLAPLKSWVHTALLDIADIKGIQTIPPKLTLFPNLREIAFHIHGPKDSYKNMYHALCTFLAKMPYYDNLTHLGISWYEYTIATGGPLSYYPPKEETRRLNYERGFETLTPEQQDILGPYIPTEAFVEMILNGDLRLPNHLRSFQLGVSNYAAYHFLPLLQCPTITTLSFNSFPQYIRSYGPETPPSILPNIKTLKINLFYSWGSSGTPSISLPNLENVVVSQHSALRWFDLITRLPSAKRFVLPWPKARLQYLDFKIIQDDVFDLISEGKVKKLESLKFFGFDETDGCKREIALACLISYDERGNRDIRWTGDVDYQNDPRLVALGEELYPMRKRRNSDSSEYETSGSESELGSEYSDTEYIFMGDKPYTHSDDSETDGDYGGDSEYWDSGEESPTKSDDEMLDDNGL